MLDVVTPLRRADGAYRAPLARSLSQLVHPDHRPARQRPPDSLAVPVLDEGNQLVVADLLDEVGDLLGEDMGTEDRQWGRHGR